MSGNPLKILIVGGGGREHAMTWKIASSPRAQHIYVAPGNAGTSQEPNVTNVPIYADDIEALCDFARDQAIDLTLVGPEAPLVSGITDCFMAAGLRCFGPTRRAAQLEGSKAFCKDFLTRHGIPTAGYRVFDQLSLARDYIQHQPLPLVVKADGLAAGKGVIIAHTLPQALSAVENMLTGNTFGEAGRRVVIEEYLRGEEASFMVLVDGHRILPLASSQDHKARDNGDQGPNTGGMGAYSPAPVVTPALHQRIIHEIIEPTVRGMAAEGYPYRGFLYAGLMIDRDATLKVLEYNCRLGDPEAQPVLMRLRSDLLGLCEAAEQGRLDTVPGIDWDLRSALGVVMVASGYPGPYRKGQIIVGLPPPDHPSNQRGKFFHGGTMGTPSGEILTDGGRVLCATALGDTIQDAQQAAYALVDQVSWEELYYRTDIGYRAMAP